MRLYDTATRSLRPLESSADPVTLYVCGITPYDASHLGHAFTYHVFDVLTRRLVAAGQQVRSVRNVTDVDDDIFRVARERHVDARALIAEQVARFDTEMTALGILPVTAAPQASDHVPEMIDWVRRLEAGGAAYAKDGWAYFSVAAFPRYGALCRLPREEMITRSRENGADPDDPRKRDPLDFVLWQPSQPDELAWDSPWSRGRPGWHIECSVLAADFLGLPVDIHGGGDDLVYPHHESEIAQVEATGVEPFARHWVHVALVQLHGVKMSKSLGNLVFVRDLLARAPAGAVRLLLAAHHHRAAWSYEAEELSAARGRHDGYAAVVERSGRLDPERAARLEGDFFAALDDDLDTPGALLVLDTLAGEVWAASPRRSSGVDGGGLLARLLGVLGVTTEVAAPAS